MMGEDLAQHTNRSMKRFGGGFVKALAEAWSRADLENRRKLETAFPELFQQYSQFPREPEPK